MCSQGTQRHLLFSGEPIPNLLFSAFTLNTCSTKMPTCLVTRNQGLLKPRTVT